MVEVIIICIMGCTIGIVKTTELRPGSYKSPMRIRDTSVAA